MESKELTYETFDNEITYLYDSCRWLKLPDPYTMNRWYDLLKGIHPAVFKKALEGILEANKINFLETPIQYQILEAAGKIEIECWKMKQAQELKTGQKLIGDRGQQEMDDEDRAAALECIAEFKKNVGGGKVLPFRSLEEKEANKKFLNKRFGPV